MSNCSNCFNGCTDITSDKCIRYTGVDIPALEILEGDTLLSIEQKITEYLISTLDGTGIKLILDPIIICELVSKYLVLEEDITVVTIISALTQAICDLQEQLNSLVEDVASINNPYEIDCLEEASSDSSTHDIVQILINRICTLTTGLEAVVLDIDTNYVKTNDLDSLIDQHLEDTSSLISNKMIPYTAMEYYGPLTGMFDVTGAGIGDWINVFLCNGNNGTPDKRGRVAIGTTSGMGGHAFHPNVDPALSGNPSYNLNSIGGINNVIITASQIPAHTHVTHVNVSDAGHFHFQFNNNVSNPNSISATNYPFRGISTGGNMGYEIVGDNTVATLGKTNSSNSGISVEVTNDAVGGNLAHSNIQPVLACHYIIYIP